MIAMSRRHVTRNIWVASLKVKVTEDLEAKLCPTHNFFIQSLILKLFHRNGCHIKTTCRAQYLGRFLKGQGHIMTLKQNCVRPITLLFEVRI